MKKFNFRLEKLLKYKEMLELEAQKNFLNYEREFLQKKEELQGIKNTILDLEENVTKKDKDIKYLKNFYSYLSSMKLKENRQYIDLLNFSEQLRKKREEFLNKVRERKILENLKLKKYNSYKKEIEKENQKIFDDIAGQKHLRNKMEGE